MLGLKRKNRQSQEVSSNSTAIQAGGNVTYVTNGLDVVQARRLFMDLFEENFYTLSKESAKMAEARVNELLDEFTSRAATEVENPEVFSDPDMQFSLYQAEAAYARTGEADLGEVLVNILLQRANATRRDLLQITLNEALQVAPKLSSMQIDTLSLIFIITRTKITNLRNIGQLIPNLSGRVEAFVNTAVSSDSSYSHLEYSGCGSINHLSDRNDLYSIIEKVYPLFFQAGFDRDFADENLAESSRGIMLDDYIRLGDIVPHPYIEGKFILNFEDLESLEKSLKERYKLSIEKIGTIKLKVMTKADENLSREYVKRDPVLAILNDLLNNSDLSKFMISSVGIALAHANIKAKTENLYDISIWITGD